MIAFGRIEGAVAGRERGSDRRLLLKILTVGGGTSFRGRDGLSSRREGGPQQLSTKMFCRGSKKRLSHLLVARSRAKQIM